MRFSSFLLPALIGSTSAAPSLDKRQQTQNELSEGPCKKITFIWARASTERGNMGGSMGPVVCRGLKAKYNNDVSCQGVGGPYTAGLGENMLPAGTSAAAIGEATKWFDLAASKCPQSIIVAGGYSQGSAVMMNAVSKLPPALQSKVVGTVLFGYTKNGQQKGGIPNYPQSRVRVYCSQNDGVCFGRLSVTAGHFSYMRDGSGPKAIEFLSSQIDGGGR